MSDFEFDLPSDLELPTVNEMRGAQVVRAPFSPEQVANLNRWQQLGYVHEFTCGHDHPEPRALVATEAGWVCRRTDCDYTQDWAYRRMTEGDFPPNPLQGLTP